MQYQSLETLINGLIYGTKLQIGVVFFGEMRCDELILPFRSTLHTAEFCEHIKLDIQKQKKCARCRSIAIKKAIRTKEPFIGICLNGLCEYTHPIVIKDKVIGIIFIGNILNKTEGLPRILKKLNLYGFSSDTQMLLQTMEQEFDIVKCKAFADTIESYIKLLLREKPISNSKAPKNTLILDLIRFCDDNIDTGIDYKILSEIFHYNEKYLGRIFKKETGISIRMYICQKRIERAAELLKNTKLSVLEIALRTGFDNVNYFNRRFKEFMDDTPTEYRKKF